MQPLRIRRLTRQFGDRVVLDSIDLDLAPGERAALLGRSGVGKTTLLRTLAGLDTLPPEAELTGPTPIAMVFQEPRLLPWQKVWRNVALGLDGDHIRPRVDAALREVGLEHHINAWPATLSGGEAQRVALARALVRKPGLLLLDEPFAALDGLTRLSMHALLEQLWRIHAPTTLMVTHDIDEALLLADRVLVLAEGKLVFDVRVELPRPRRHDDAGFVELRLKLLRELRISIPDTP